MLPTPHRYEIIAIVSVCAVLACFISDDLFTVVDCMGTKLVIGRASTACDRKVRDVLNWSQRRTANDKPDLVVIRFNDKTSIATSRHSYYEGLYTGEAAPQEEPAEEAPPERTLEEANESRVVFHHADAGGAAGASPGYLGPVEPVDNVSNDVIHNPYAIVAPTLAEPVGTSPEPEPMPSPGSSEDVASGDSEF